MNAPVSARHARSLSRSILVTVLAFTLVAVLATAIALVTVAYLSEEERSEGLLVEQARSCAQVLEEYPADARVGVLEQQFAGPERFTLIDPAGNVIFDTAVRDGALENHFERPEMLAAEHAGEGVLVRHSDTLNRDTVYVAERLSDGYFVRVSEERLSLPAFLGSMALPVGIVLVIAVILVIMLSRFLTSRIMRPLDELDVHDPLSGDAYEEMRPLLLRIDEQKEQLRRQNEELKEADGLRREFSANVSHEMKTPLQVISGSAEMIASGLVDPDDVEEFARRIYLESQRLRALINDVLTLSRLDESSFASAARVPVDMLELVQRTCERLRPLAREHGIDLEFDGAELRTLGNEALLEQAAAAVKASPAELPARVEALNGEMKELRHAVEKFQAEASLGEARQFLMSAKDVKGLKVLTATRNGMDANGLRQMGDFLRDKEPNVVAVLASTNEEKITFLAVCGKQAIAKGIKAGDLVKSVCALCGGKGGGKPDSAMGGGKDLLKLDDALASVDDFVAVKLGL